LKQSRSSARIQLAQCIIAAIFLLISLGCGGVSSGGTGASGSGGTGGGAPTGPLGVVTKSEPVACSGVNASNGTANASCYKLTVSCPDVANQDMTVKVNAPAGASLGTVLFTIGGGGSGWYDQRFTYGTLELNTLIDANFTTAQLNWSINPVGFPTAGTFAGWLTGPGGPLKTACRWATAAKWVHDNSGITRANTAFCATGNSGGSGAIAYALAHYDLDSLFDMVEETAGPPYTRIDKGCICDAASVQPTPCGQGTLSECFLGDAQLFIDPSYDPLGNVCSSAESTHSTADAAMFLNDSIMGSTPKLSYPNTIVRFVFGGQDATAAVPLAMEWQTAITAKDAPTAGSTQIDCVADAPHDMPSAQDAALKIAHDLIQFCHK